jgi:hypothetical protein
MMEIGKHVDLITKKAFTRVNIMSTFKFILDRRTLEKKYLTFIRPFLEYGDVVWDCKTVYLTIKLESVQAEAAIIVTGGTRLVSLSCRNRVGIFERQKGKHCSTYFYKMNDGLSPGYLSSLVPNTLRNIHDHNTRHSTLIPPVRARTTLYANYFLPQTVHRGGSRWGGEHPARTTPAPL